MNKRPQIIFLILLVVVCGLIGGLLGATRRGAPQKRSFSIEARKYAYDPPRIRVNRGDKIILKLTSQDVTHGFYLEGYDIDAKIRAQYPHFWLKTPSQNDEYEQVDEITFVAKKAGKFRYRCSITCGSFHPFMQGELIVEPNFVYPISIGVTIGLAVSMISFLAGERN